jgi:MFS family permease
VSALGRIVSEYRQTWNQAGVGGQAVLLGTFTYIFRVVGFAFLLPLYVKASGYSNEDFGVLFATMSIVPIIGLPVILFLARRGWDRRLMMGGSLIAALGIVTLIAAREAPFPVWFIGAVLVGVSGATYWTLSDPLLAESVETGLRARAYALKWLFFILGSSLGSLTAGVLPDVLQRVASLSERNAYWLVLFVFAGVELTTVWIFRRVPVRSFRGEEHANPVPFRVIGVTLLLLGTAEAAFGLGYNSIRPFMSIFLTERQGLSSGTAGLVISSTAIFAAIGGLLMPTLATKIGNAGALALLRMLGAGCVAAWFFVGSLPAVLAFVLLYYALLDGTSALYASEVMSRLPASARDIMAGVNSVLWSAVSAVAAALSGFLQDRPGGGFGLAFSVGIAGYVLSAIWCLLVLPRVRVRSLEVT